MKKIMIIGTMILLLVLSGCYSENMTDRAHRPNGTIQGNIEIVAVTTTIIPYSAEYSIDEGINLNVQNNLNCIDQTCSTLVDMSSLSEGTHKIQYWISNYVTIQPTEVYSFVIDRSEVIER